MIKSPNVNFISCLGNSHTYKEIDELSDNIAFYLLEKIAKNELSTEAKIAIKMPNLSQYVIIMLGVLKAGLTVVNCNPLYTEDEIKHQLLDSEAEMIFVLSNIALPLTKIYRETKLKKIIKTELFDLHPTYKKTILNFVAKNIKKMVPETPWIWENLLSVLKKGQAAKSSGGYCLDLDYSPEKNAFLQYTGGTTGVSKGAILTHKNIVSNVFQAYEAQPKAIKNIDHKKLKKDSHGYVFMPLPVFHIYTLTCLFGFGVLTGLTCVLVTNPRDPKMLYKDLLSYPYTVFIGINTLYLSLLNNPLLKKLRFTPEIQFLAGGMALLPEIATRWEKTVGAPIIEGYGATEMSPIALINHSRRPNNNITGYPLSNTIAKVVDENENDLPLGDKSKIGELWFKGPQIMKGYYGMEKENIQVMENGWFKTGDLGFIDENGGIKIVDRKKDVIIIANFDSLNASNGDDYWGAENVYPAEVEDVILKHPKVQECAVVGKLEVEKGGEIVVAHIVPKETVSAEEIIEFCRRHLISYKVPKEIIFAKELPKNNIGKVLRRHLKNFRSNDQKVK